MDDIEKAKRAERLVNYANRTNDMRQIKSQQWLIVYYCSLLFAGIIGLTTAIKSTTDIVGSIMFLLTLMIPVFGIRAIIRNHKILVADRIETLEIEKKFYTKLEYHKSEIKPLYVSYWFHWQYWLSFKLAIIVGCCFTLWYLSTRYCISNGIIALLYFIMKILHYKMWLTILITFTLGWIINFTIVCIKKNAIDKFEKIKYYQHHC